MRWIVPAGRFGRVALVFFVLVASAAASGQDAPAAAPAPAAKRPAYSFLRFTEDWSVLRDMDPSLTADPWDGIKYVPISDDGSVWASFGGHLRLRSETWRNFAFGAPADNDDTFLMTRLALHADVHFGENVRAFIEGKSALSTDRDLPGGRRTLDVDSAAVEQAFIDLTVDLGADATLVLRPGRQTFLFGKQRLVSPLPWANTLRRWDGVSAIVQTGPWNIHGFWAQFVPVRKYDYNRGDRHTQLYGVYATGAFSDGVPGVDLYFLGLDVDDPVTFNGTTGSERRFTLGGRVFGKIGETGVDYDAEGAYQFGEVGAGDVSAFMVGSQVGWRPEGWAGKPRLFAGFDYATGDDGAGGDVETFNQLFPLGHAYLGYADFIGRQNIIDLSIGVTVEPLDRLRVQVATHFFWRDDTSDAVYNAGGAVVRAGGLGSAREIGQELDVTMSYKLDAHTALELGYSRFFAGDFIEQSGASDDIDFLYLQMQYTF